MPAEVGHQAPDVTLVNYERKPVRLSELRGKPTVLLFFPAAYTGTCTKEMCTFRDAMAAYGSLDAQVFGVSVDMPYSQKAWAEHHGLNFPLMSDYNRQAVRAFGVEDPNFAGGMLPGVAMRSAFVLDRQGVIRYRWVADKQGTEPDYAAVEAAVRALS